MLGMSPFFLCCPPELDGMKMKLMSLSWIDVGVIHFSNGNVTNSFLLSSSSKFDEFLVYGSLSSSSLFLFNFYFDDVTLSHVREIESSVGMERARVFAEKA